MKNYLFKWTISAVFLMLIVPYLLLRFVSSDAAMIVCMMLLFGVNIIFAAYTGWKCGKDIHLLWTLPFALDVLFVIGYNLLLEMNFTDTMYYVTFYTVIAYIGMFISVRRK